MSGIQLATLAEAFVQAVNQGDGAAFSELFAENAVVDDAGRVIRGRAAIDEWARSDIFAVQVSFEVVEASEGDGQSIVTTKVDGNFDRTGLPDPLLIEQHLTFADGKITRLECRPRN